MAVAIMFVISGFVIYFAEWLSSLMIKYFTEPLANGQKFLFTLWLTKRKIYGEESIAGKVLQVIVEMAYRV